MRIKQENTPTRWRQRHRGRRKEQEREELINDDMKGTERRADEGISLALFVSDQFPSSSFHRSNCITSVPVPLLSTSIGFHVNKDFSAD